MQERNWEAGVFPPRAGVSGPPCSRPYVGRRLQETHEEPYHDPTCPTDAVQLSPLVCVSVCVYE